MNGEHLGSPDVAVNEYFETWIGAIRLPVPKISLSENQNFDPGISKIASSMLPHPILSNQRIDFRVRNLRYITVRLSYTYGPFHAHFSKKC